MDLNEISKNYNINVEELTKVESDLRKKYSSVAGIMPPEQVEKYIMSGVQQHIDKYKNLGLTQFFGVILMVSQPKDGVAKRRSTAFKKYSENPELAITSGIVQEYKDGIKRFLQKGVIITKAVNQDAIPKSAMYLPDQKAYVVPLDERETWPSGKKNFGYLKPLPLEQYFTSIEGISSLDGINWSAFKMMLNCTEHINTPNVNIPQSKLVKFLAKVKTKEPLVLNYNNKYTKFEVIDGDITQLNAEIMNFYDVITLADVDATYKNRKTAYDSISIFGQVRNKWTKEPTDDKPFPWTTINITDNTRDAPLKLLIHPDMSAQFEEQSIVKVWGSLSEGNKWDPDLGQQTDEKEITMFATGVYMFSMNEVIPETETEVDDGWSQ